MIELKIDGEVYTKKQYEKDYVRMMDSLREECIGERNCSSVDCEDCPLYEETCHTHRDEASDYRCLDTVEIVHDWAKTHPGKTNREKLKEVFNVNIDKNAEIYLSYYAGQRVKFDLTVEDRWINQPINKWLDAEYKEPGKDKQNG